jgi:hypothetical protein
MPKNLYKKNFINTLLVLILILILVYLFGFFLNKGFENNNLKNKITGNTIASLTCSGGGCVSSYPLEGFFATNSSNPTGLLIPVEKILDSYQSNIFTWQNLYFKFEQCADANAKLPSNFSISIYNPGFNSTSEYYDPTRKRNITSCLNKGNGNFECNVGGQCISQVVSGDQKIICTIKIPFYLTRLNDEISVKLNGPCNQTKNFESKKIIIGSCPYDSICKSNTRENDAYWSHNPLNKGYDDAGLNPGKYRSCELFEVCSPFLDKLIDEAEEYCKNSKSELNYKSCLSNYAIEQGLGPYGYPSIQMGFWMHSYWQQEIAYQLDSTCSVKNISSSFFLNSRNITFQASTTIFPTWNNDTDYSNNSCYMYDIPSHVTLLRLRTGVCADYSVSLTTILRKMGYNQEEAYSVGAPQHAYNLVKSINTPDFIITDTTGNKDQSLVIPNWNDSLIYNYCTIQTIRNDNLKPIAPKIEIIENINGCDCKSPNNIFFSLQPENGFLCCKPGETALYKSGNTKNKCCNQNNTFWGTGDYAEIGNKKTSVCCSSNSLLTYDQGKLNDCCELPNNIIWGVYNYSATGNLETSICCKPGETASFFEGYPEKCCSPFQTLTWGTGDYSETGSKKSSVCCYSSSEKVVYSAGIPMSCCASPKVLAWGAEIYNETGSQKTAKCCDLGQPLWYNNGYPLQCCESGKIAVWGKPGSGFEETGQYKTSFCCNPGETGVFDTNPSSITFGKIKSCS